MTPLTLTTLNPEAISTGTSVRTLSSFITVALKSPENRMCVCASVPMHMCEHTLNVGQSRCGVYETLFGFTVLFVNICFILGTALDTFIAVGFSIAALVLNNAVPLATTE